MKTEQKIHKIFKNCPDILEFRKLRKRIIRLTRETIEDYNMIEDRGKWLVCLSGGKDSFTLLASLIELKWRGLLPLDFLACNLDQGQPGFPSTILPQFLENLEIPFRIEYQDTYSIVKSKVPSNKTYCSLCSRLRRAHLYRIAREENCTAIVLGHHQDDILETFFMNLFHGGKLSSMPPKLLNDEGDLFLLRPLAKVSEKDCLKFSNYLKFPIIPCDLCGSQEGLERQNIKAMLEQWEQEFPGRKQIMYKSLSNSKPSHLLDKSLFNFKDLVRN
jgi:tRNA 2-thiocytidine biosynthesis protein TtcA